MLHRTIPGASFHSVVAGLVAAVALCCSSVVPAAIAQPLASVEAELERLGAAFARGEGDSVWEGASELLGSLGPERGASACRLMVLRGRVMADRGRFASALREIEGGLALLGAHGAIGARVEALVVRSRVERARGDAAAARASLDDADRWARLAGPSLSGAPLWETRAEIALLSDRGAEARRAVAGFVGACTGTRCGAAADRLRGRLAGLAGDLAGAGELLRRAELAFARAGRVRERLEVLVEWVEVERALDDRIQARAAAEIAAGLAARIGHRRLGADLARVRGELLVEAGEAESALALLETARALYTEMHARSGVAGSRLALGRAAIAQGRTHEATIHFEAARALYTEMGDAPRLRTAWRGLAECARRMGDGEREAAWLERLVGADGPGSIWEPATRLAEMSVASRDFERARGLADAALHDLESLEGRLGSPASRSRLLHARKSAQGLLVDAWLGDADVPRARAYAEALRAANGALSAGFSDTLARALSLRELPEAQTLAQRVAALDRMIALAAAGDPAFEPAAIYSLGNLRARLRRELSATETPRRPLDSAGPDIARLVASLREDVALVLFHLGTPTSRGFVVTQDGVSVATLPDRAALDSLIVEFHERVRTRPSSARGRRARVAASRALYQALFVPLLPHLGARSRLVIVPDGALRTVPFDALVTNSAGSPHFAVERFTLSQVPSLGSLVSLETEAARRRARTDRFPFVGFADPDGSPRDAEGGAPLRGAALEVEWARRRLGADAGPGTLFLGSEATERALVGLALDRYAIVHLATHGTAGDSLSSAGAPALFFGPGGGEDGLLKLEEAIRLRLDADLVVLSACDTARGDLAAGEGFDGLTGAFLRAGSSAVLATLWEVEDTVTPRVMDRFYEGLAGAQSVPASLRSARLDALRGALRSGSPAGSVDGSREQRILARARDPFYWGAFVVVGTSSDIFR